jgi:hypothetical protein
MFSSKLDGHRTFFFKRQSTDPVKVTTRIKENGGGDDGHEEDYKPDRPAVDVLTS